jgi:cytoskeleton protein RodZ
MADRTTMGAYLRAARRRRRIGIEKAAEDTRIRSDFLMRMESDEFDFLAPTYVRGFLKSYARYLRVDPDPLLEEFDRRVGKRTESQQVMALEKHRGRDMLPTRRRMSSWGVAASLAAGVLLLLAGIGLVQGDDPGPRDRTPVAGVPKDEKTAEPSESPSATVASPSPAETVALTDDIIVEVVAVNGNCWVLAAEDGEEVNPAGETLVQGDSLTFEGEEKVFIRLGLPASVELIVNGSNIGSPGGTDPINLTFPDDIDAI